MALRKMISGRFLHLPKHSSTIAAPSLPATYRKVLQRRPISQLATWMTVPAGIKLIEIIRSSMNRDPDKIRLHELVPPPTRLPKTNLDHEDHGECANKARISAQDELMMSIRSSMSPDCLTLLHPAKSETEMEANGGFATNKMTISVQEARKLLKASRIETARAKLREIPNSRVSYSDFLQICREIAGGSDELAAALENAGVVIVLGDIVFLRPEQLAWAIEKAILPQQSVSDPRKSELSKMEAVKTAIDGKAESQVRIELWAGLGFGLLQTACFMRLTFWELSWDVMEPICFFAASFYFMISWAFFMRTKKEPSFEGFYAGRFAAKQRRLMKAHSFDLRRFNELRSAHLHSSCHCHCHCQRN